MECKIKLSKKEEEEIVFVKQAGAGLQLNRGEFECYCKRIDVEDLSGPMFCFDKKDTRGIWMRISGLNGDVQMFKKDCAYQFMIEDINNDRTLRVKDVHIEQIWSDDIICMAKDMHFETVKLNLNIQV